MSISDRLDQIEADIPLAARSPEMAQHFTYDHGPELLAAVRDVLDLHEPIHALDYGAPVRGGRLTHVCTGCGQDDGNWQYWPCPTVRAIATALGEDQP